MLLSYLTIWAARSVEYLGYQVGEGLLSIPQARLNSIQTLSQPKTVKQLRSFLGTVGYYRQFVPQFSTHSAELTPSTKKGMPTVINWSPIMCSSFHALKSSLSSVLCLTIPNSCDMFTLVTDASGRGPCLKLCRIMAGRTQNRLPIFRKAYCLTSRGEMWEKSHLT